MVLTLIGLGLCDKKDITVKGLEAVKGADYVYLESFTSILPNTSKECLEAFYEKEVIVADRGFVEGDCNEIIERSRTHNVAFLVVGDPLCATTHTDIILRCKQSGIATKVIGNASIVSAAAVCGLQLYRFGEIVSIPYFDNNWTPDSFYDKIKNNKMSNLHTLCLLDIKVKEQTLENMMKGNKIFEPPRYMTVNEALAQISIVEGKRKEEMCAANARGFALARVGADDELIVSGTLSELATRSLGGPLHCLVIAAPELHDMENQFYELYKAE